MRIAVCLCGFSFFPGYACGQELCYSVNDFAKLPKIDMHTHVHTEVLDFVAFARRDRIQLLNMAVDEGDDAKVSWVHQTTYKQYRAAPDRIAAVVSFSMNGWDAPDWQAKTIRYIDDAAKKGAIGIKVWKNIGMDFRDRSGKLVMIDDAKFDPILKHLARKGMVLIAHLGEPKNCWLPLEKMTVKGDRSYFKENPKYHMHLHPDLPSYDDQIAARDRMLAKHPKLNFVGAHLGSLEWSTDEMAGFLDRFPNATLGCAARIAHLQYLSQSDRTKVTAFLDRYQDRIMYGTDLYVSPTALATEAYEKARENWLRDWRYFNTDEMIEVYDFDVPVQGLALPKKIVNKLYRENAKRVFKNAWP